jgi:hypothetical protein
MNRKEFRLTGELDELFRALPRTGMGTDGAILRQPAN